MTELMQALAILKTPDMKSLFVSSASSESDKESVKVLDLLPAIFLDFRSNLINKFLTDMKTRLTRGAPVGSMLQGDDREDPREPLLGLKSNEDSHLVHLDLFDLFLHPEDRNDYLQLAYRGVNQHRVVPASLFLTEEIPEVANLASLRKSIRTSLKSPDYRVMFREALRKAERLNPMAWYLLWKYAFLLQGQGFLVLRVPADSAVYVSQVWAVAQALYWKDLSKLLNDISDTESLPQLPIFPTRNIMMSFKRKLPDMKFYQGVYDVELKLNSQAFSEWSKSVNYISNPDDISVVLNKLLSWMLNVLKKDQLVLNNVRMPNPKAVRVPFLYGYSSHQVSTADSEKLNKVVLSQFRR